MQQAACIRKKRKSEKKNTKKSAPPKTHHESHSSPATTTASRRHVMKHVQRVRPRPPASIDPGFVEIGLVQLSQSVKMTHVTHTDRHRQINPIMAPRTHPSTKSFFALKTRNVLGRFGPWPCLIMKSLFCLRGKNGLVERYMRQSCLVRAAGRVRSKERNGKQTHETPPNTNKYTTKYIHSSPATATTSGRRSETR